MAGEIPDLSKAVDITSQQVLDTLAGLSVGETITIEEIYRDVGQKLFVEGLVPHEYTTEEEAANFLETHGPSAPQGEVVDDK